MSDLITYLLQTNAIKICAQDKPFFYTSGKIGPYFINTHFLYGSEKEASEFLKHIDELLSNRINLPKKVFEKVLSQYQKNEIYKNTIDTMLQNIKDNVNIDEIDYISGGERRDWYFSNIISYLLKKPHLTIFKDLETFESHYDFSSTKKIEYLTGKTVLHITDLVTTATSFVRSWIPAIKNLNGNLIWTCYVVDRKQGGTEIIENEGIKALPLVYVDPSLFQKIFEMNLINKEQLDMLNKFYKNPDNTMREFLINHPNFLNDSLNGDEKTAKRAKLCIDSNLYNLV